MVSKKSTENILYLITILYVFVLIKLLDEGDLSIYLIKSRRARNKSLEIKSQEIKSLELMGNLDNSLESTNGTQIYIVTPTYTRDNQIPDLTRLSQTLRLVPNMTWIVVEDRTAITPPVSNLLERCQIPYVHLAATNPSKNTKNSGKGVWNRRKGIEWLRKNKSEGVLYFADDDNTYDIRLFDEIRKTKFVSVFPVGFASQFGISSPIVKNGVVVGFHDHYQAGRRFPIDMAGFAVNLKQIHKYPNATMPEKLTYLEDGFLKSLNVSVSHLEPLASSCTKVYVWHTRTSNPKRAKWENARKEVSNDNLETLYENIKLYLDEIPKT